MTASRYTQWHGGMRPSYKRDAVARETRGEAARIYCRIAYNSMKSVKAAAGTPVARCHGMGTCWEDDSIAPRLARRMTCLVDNQCSSSQPANSTNAPTPSNNSPCAAQYDIPRLVHVRRTHRLVMYAFNACDCVVDLLECADNLLDSVEWLLGLGHNTHS